jgi:hypothetical protein
MKVAQMGYCTRRDCRGGAIRSSGPNVRSVRRDISSYVSCSLPKPLSVLSTSFLWMTS